MKNRTLFFLNCCLLCGCSQNIDITLPYEGKKLVMLCILSPDRVLSAQIDQTYPPTGNIIFKTVSNAVIEVYENDKLIELLTHTKNGIYESAKRLRPKIGYTYKIKARATGFPDLESDGAMIPLTPQVKNATFTRINGNILSLKIEDYPNQENQYSIQVLGTYQGNRVATNASNLSRPDGISDNCGFRGNQNNFYYRDVCFDGNVLEASYSTTLYGTVQIVNSKGNYENKDCDQVFLIIRNVGKAYFDYYKFYPPEDIELAFREPVSRFYNLKGGYGLFSVYTEVSIPFLVK